MMNYFMRILSAYIQVKPTNQPTKHLIRAAGAYRCPPVALRDKRPAFMKPPPRAWDDAAMPYAAAAEAANAKRL